MEEINIQEQVKNELDQLSFSSYKDFNYLPYWDSEKREEMLGEFKENLRNQITEILVLEIYDNVWASSENRKNLHWEIGRFIDFAEWRLKYYILKTNNDIYWVFVGSSGWSTPRTNEYYMQEFLKDPEIMKKTKVIKTKTSELMK